MHLFIDTMNAVLVEFSPNGRIRLEHEDWSTPTQQEIRAIIHAASLEIDELTELVATLEASARHT